MLFDTLMLHSFGLSLEKEKKTDGYQILPMLNFLTKWVCGAVIFWYFLTGRDTVSQLQGSSRATTCKAWEAFPEVTGAFIKLFKLGEISTIDEATTEHLIVVLYDRTSPHFSLEKEILSYADELNYQQLLTETRYLPSANMFAEQ